MNTNSDQLEKILRKAPHLAAPPGLLNRLKADIDLPKSRQSEPAQNHSPSLFKRWLPALSVAVWFLACLVILAVQSNTLTRLRFENAVARAAAEGQQLAQIAPSGGELARLRADAEEIQKLRAEIAQLTEQLNELQNLRAENQRLRAEAATAKTAAAAPTQDFFAMAAQKQENTACINNLKQIGLGARMWANDNKDAMPTSFDEMGNYLPNKAVFFCPASGGTVQYEIVSPGAPETDPAVVYARCPKHNNVVLCDGSGQILGNIHKLVVRPDGKTVIGR